MNATRAGARPRTQPPPRDDAGRTERVLAAERRIGYVAHMLDDLVAVPGTKSRVGLDPIIGLIPFLGDIVTSLVAMWIVVEAARFKLPGIVLAFLFTGRRDAAVMVAGAAVFGLLAAFFIETLNKSARVQQDAAIGITFTTLFSIGVVLVTIYSRNVDLDQECGGEGVT